MCTSNTLHLIPKAIIFLLYTWNFFVSGDFFLPQKFTFSAFPAGSWLLFTSAVSWILRIFHEKKRAVAFSGFKQHLIMEVNFKQCKRFLAAAWAHCSVKLGWNTKSLYVKIFQQCHIAFVHIFLTTFYYSYDVLWIV